MDIPVIFIHYGNSGYLQYSLLQALHHNSSVILIGDKSNNLYPFVRHEQVEDYDQAAALFATVYTPHHRSVNPLPYELFCFQRWFILRDFMKTHGFAKCCYLDSDVMLYENVSERMPAGFDILFNHWGIESYAVLDQFCTFLQIYYTDPSLLEQLKSEHPYVVDMTMMDLFDKRFPGRMCYLGRDDHSAYDANIILPERFETLRVRKKVYRIHNAPYCKDVATNQYIRMKTLHFQGIEKKFMSYFLEEQFGSDDILYFDYRFCRWLKEDESSLSAYQIMQSLYAKEGSGFVAALYNQLLNREPDPEGLRHHAGLLASGMPKTAVVSGFLQSKEAYQLFENGGSL